MTNDNVIINLNYKPPIILVAKQQLNTFMRYNRITNTCLTGGKVYSKLISKTLSSYTSFQLV